LLLLHSDPVEVVEQVVPVQDQLVALVLVVLVQD
jgi:hypothetical protein